MRVDVHPPRKATGFVLFDLGAAEARDAARLDPAAYVERGAALWCRGGAAKRWRLRVVVNERPELRLSMAATGPGVEGAVLDAPTGRLLWLPERDFRAGPARWAKLAQRDEPQGASTAPVAPGALRLADIERVDPTPTGPFYAAISIPPGRYALEAFALRWDQVDDAVEARLEDDAPVLDEIALRERVARSLSWIAAIAGLALLAYARASGDWSGAGLTIMAGALALACLWGWTLGLRQSPAGLDALDHRRELEAHFPEIVVALSRVSPGATGKKPAVLDM